MHCNFCGQNSLQAADVSKRSVCLTHLNCPPTILTQLKNRETFFAEAKKQAELTIKSFRSLEAKSKTLFHLFAPPGYGKTTAAQIFLRTFTSKSVDYSFGVTVDFSNGDAYDVTSRYSPQVHLALTLIARIFLKDFSFGSLFAELQNGNLPTLEKLADKLTVRLVFAALAELLDSVRVSLFVLHLDEVFNVSQESLRLMLRSLYEWNYTPLNESPASRFKLIVLPFLTGIAQLDEEIKLSASWGSVNLTPWLNLLSEDSCFDIILNGTKPDFQNLWRNSPLLLQYIKGTGCVPRLIT